MERQQNFTPKKYTAVNILSEIRYEKLRVNQIRCVSLWEIDFGGLTLAKYQR